MQVWRGLICVLAAFAACSGDSKPNAVVPSSSSASSGSASPTDGPARCHEARIAQINGRAVPVADGGLLALANGQQQSLVKAPSGQPLPVKLLWLVKAAPGTSLTFTARGPDGGRVQWLLGVAGPRADAFSATTEAQSAPGTSPDWSDVPSLLAVSAAGCYEVNTAVESVSQMLTISVT